MSDGILENIHEKLDSINIVSKGVDLRLTKIETKLENFPNENRVREIVREVQTDCPAYNGFGDVADRSAENTGVIRVLQSQKRNNSLVPQAISRLPRWAQVLLVVLGSSGGGVGLTELVKSLMQ